MEDQPNTDISTKSRGEKYDLESPEIVTSTPTINRSRLLLNRLLAWGVESRGGCRILDSKHNHP